MDPVEVALIVVTIAVIALLATAVVHPYLSVEPNEDCTVKGNHTHIIQLEGSAICGALIDDLTEKGWRLHTYTDPYPFLARPQYVLVYPLSPSSTTTAASSDVNATAVDTLPLRCSGKGCPLPPSSDD